MIKQLDDFLNELMKSKFMKRIAIYSFSTAKRSQFYRVMANATNEKAHGIKVQDALRIMTEFKRKENKFSLSAILYDSMLRDLAVGSNIGKSLQNYVPKNEALVIMANNTNVSQGFVYARSLLNQTTKLNKAFKNALMMPAIQLTLVYVFFYYLFTSLLPTFTTGMSSGENSDFTPLQNLTLFLTNYFNWWYYELGVVILLMVYGVFWLIPNYARRKRLDAIPPFSIYKLVSGISFLYTLNALLMSKMAMANALRIIEVNANPYISYRMNGFIRALKDKGGLGNALVSTKFNFPNKEIVDEIAMINKTGGSIDGSLESLIETLSVDGLEMVERQAKVLNTVAMGFLAGVLVFTIAVVLAAQTSVQNSLS